MMTTMKRSFKGLTPEQVLESREKYGNNILTPTDKESVWKRFFEKFKDPLIIILIVAGVLSLGISIYEYMGLGGSWSAFFEPAGILLAILLSTTLAFIFELKSDKEFSLLNQVDDEELVVVIRKGKYTKIPKKDVVVGDIVIIENGCEIPADAELLESTSLSINESSLTGEPLCRKNADPAGAIPDATYPSNRVYRGTKVMEGHGICRVFAVGDSTEYGKVYKQAQIDNQVKTPLNEQLDRLGGTISTISYVLAVLILVGRAFVFLHGLDGAPIVWIEFLSYMLQSIMIAVTLIVVAVPEGLPMAVTLSLAYSMRKMLATNNLVRKMHACETMGAATVICTDKTGTLTQNEMRVSDVWVAPEVDDNLLYQSIAINSTASVEDNNGKIEVIGNPTEGALLLWLKERDIDYATLRSMAEVKQELPFTTENKYMATVVRQSKGVDLLLVKGAPEIIRKFCDISSEELAFVKDYTESYQKRGMRMLALAVKELRRDDAVIANGKLYVSGLKLISLFALSDPVREDVPAAVRECLDAGIDVKIVTGDNPVTAMEIGRQIGIWTDADSSHSIITGPELSTLTDEQLELIAKKLKIIARARPSEKERLVRALQARGEVVAVTGDGTNDAPALNAAHVGLSMGDGTSVAKEASDITIIDNSFASIGRAVLWGRTLYRNIQRFILFQMTVNMAACLIVLCGAFMGVQSPLTVTQMLWINLIMDTFAAMALASLPPDKELMKNTPRNRYAFIIDRKLFWHITITGGIFCILMVWFTYLMEHADIRPGIQGLHLGSYNGISEYESGLFFTAFVFLQFWNLFNAKAYGTDKSALSMKNCGSFLFIAALIFVGQLAIIYLGGEFFNVAPLELDDLLKIIATTSGVLVFGEMIRFIRNRFNSANTQLK